MTRIFLALLSVLLLLSGCSGKSADALKETKPAVKKETPAIATEQSKDQTAEYITKLQEEMNTTKGAVASVLFEKDKLIRASKMYYAIDSSVIAIETMNAPEPLKEKHETLVTHLKTAKLLLQQAQSDFLNKDEKNGSQKVEQAMQSFGNANDVLSEITKTPSP